MPRCIAKRVPFPCNQPQVEPFSSRGHRPRNQPQSRALVVGEALASALSTITLCEDPKHQELYDYNTLQSLHFCSTKWVNEDDIESIGILDEMNRLANAVGMGSLMTRFELTYKNLTAEFLAFLSVFAKHNWGSAKEIKFRLNNERRDLLISEVLDIYDFSKLSSEVITTRGADLFWLKVSGFSNHNHYSKASCLVYPVFRGIQCYLAETILYREDTCGGMRRDKIMILKGMVENHHVDFSRLMVKQWLSLRRQSTGTLAVGGLITPIIDHFNILLEGHEEIPDEHSFDLTLLRKYRILKISGSLFTQPVHLL